MLASSAVQMVYTDPNRLNQLTIRGRSMKNLLAVIGVIVVIKKGYELFREYNEMKQEQEKCVGDSACRSTASTTQLCLLLTGYLYALAGPSLHIHLPLFLIAIDQLEQDAFSAKMLSQANQVPSGGAPGNQCAMLS